MRTLLDLLIDLTSDFCQITTAEKTHDIQVKKDRNQIYQYDVWSESLDTHSHWKHVSHRDLIRIIVGWTFSIKCQTYFHTCVLWCTSRIPIILFYNTRQPLYPTALSLSSCVSHLSIRSPLFSLSLSVSVHCSTIELLCKPPQWCSPLFDQRSFWFVPITHIQHCVICCLGKKKHKKNNQAHFCASVRCHVIIIIIWCDNMWILLEAALKGNHVTLSVDRNNSVAKGTSRCSRKLWRRASASWSPKAGYEILGYGISQRGWWITNTHLRAGFSCPRESQPSGP